VAAAAVGFTVLGDAAAAIVGRAYGRVRFFGKTAEGAAAGLVACLAWAGYLAVAGHLEPRIAIAGALVASLVEFLPIPIDDNLAITLFSGYTMKLLLAPIS
jgi:dolichol kinase